METIPTHISQAIEKFNPAQKEAVLNTEGPTLIVAGAGSGKTSVLTARIALLMAQGVMPERILALTFTKKAAEEMRNRIIALQGPAASRICMGTFHSVFIRFIRPFAERIGFPVNFTILDEEDALSALKKCINAVVAPDRPPRKEWTKEQEALFKETDQFYRPKLISSVISMCKNELIDAERYALNDELVQRDVQARRPLLKDIFREYMDTCRRMAVMDFDDILLYTDKMLEANPDILAMVSGQFDYILVDEYQDTNYAQYSILRRLTWINKNISVVGDDSQSIYAFRGARIQNIMNFKTDYPDCRVIKLEQNYRSTKNIVNAANNLISRNENRIPKVCFSRSTQGEPITLKTCGTEREEAAFIASEIISRKEEQGLSFSDFAVLYRTNAQSRAIEDAMVKERIPYVVYSGVSFFSRSEIKDVMAYYRLAINPRDNESFLRVVNKPTRGFGEAAQKRLYEIARSWGLSLYDTASNPQIQLCGFSTKALGALNEFVATINECIGITLTNEAYEAAKQISDKAGFYGQYMLDGDEDSLKRADNIRELVDSVKAYEEELQKRNEALEGEKETSTLGGYLQNIMLLSNADTDDGKDDKVSLMTVHCAKGLEYPTVFIAGMDKTLFPLEIEKTQSELEEERRLFYVAVTRAKKDLVLTRANTRIRYGERKQMQRSPFINELINKKKIE